MTDFVKVFSFRQCDSVINISSSVSMLYTVCCNSPVKWRSSRSLLQSCFFFTDFSTRLRRKRKECVRSLLLLHTSDCARFRPFTLYLSLARGSFTRDKITWSSTKFPRSNRISTEISRTLSGSCSVRDRARYGATLHEALTSQDQESSIGSTTIWSLARSLGSLARSPICPDALLLFFSCHHPRIWQVVPKKRPCVRLCTRNVILGQTRTFEVWDAEYKGKYVGPTWCLRKNRTKCAHFSWSLSEFTFTFGKLIPLCISFFSHACFTLRLRETQFTQSQNRKCKILCES